MALKPVALWRALAWLEANGAEILAPRPTWLRGIKRVAEAVMLAEVLLDEDLARVDPAFAVHARDWLESAWRALRGGDFLVDCVERDPEWIGLALTYAPFHRHGLRSERFEALLAARGNELSAGWFVELAVACAYHRLGIATTLDADRLAREAWIFRTGQTESIDPARAYETTHVVFWLSALGRIPPDLRDRLTAATPGWIDHYMHVQNVDIVAELVMMSHHLGGCAAEPVWTWLLASQDADGSFPAPELPSRALSRFHATAVAAMALGLCLGGKRCLTPGGDEVEGEKSFHSP